MAQATAPILDSTEAGQSLADGCPQLVEADIRAFGRHSGFDPTATLAVQRSSRDNFDFGAVLVPAVAVSRIAIRSVRRL